MRALALLMFVAATVPMAFMRPVIGLMLWILFSYMNPHRIAYGFATAFPWVMIVAVVTMVSTLAHAQQRQALRMTPLMVLMTLFLLWTGLSTLDAVVPAQAEIEWVRFFKIMLMVYFTAILVTDKQRLHWVLWTIVLSFGFWGFKGGFFTLITGGSHNVMGPIKSFYRDTNGFALVMCMCLPLMRYLQLQDHRKWVRVGLWGLMGLTAVAIVGTYSRGGLLALGITVLMLIYKSRRRASLFLVVPIMAVLVASFMPQEWYSRMNTINEYEQDQSAQGRIHSWKFAVNVAIDNPLLGGGMRVWSSDAMWDTYGPPDAVHRAIHSIFFQVLGEAGFVGLALFVAMLAGGWFGLARIRRKARAGPDTAWMGDLASMMQVSLVAYAAAGSLLPMPYFDLFYQILVMTTVLDVLLMRAHASGEPQTATESPRPASGRRAVGGRRPTIGRPLRPGTQGGGQQDLPWY